MPAFSHRFVALILVGALGCPSSLTAMPSLARHANACQNALIIQALAQPAMSDHRPDLPAAKIAATQAVQTIPVPDYWQAEWAIPRRAHRLEVSQRLRSAREDFTFNDTLAQWVRFSTLSAPQLFAAALFLDPLTLLKNVTQTKHGAHSDIASLLATPLDPIPDDQIGTLLNFLEKTVVPYELHSAARILIMVEVQKYDRILRHVTPLALSKLLAGAFIEIDFFESSSDAARSVYESISRIPTERLWAAQAVASPEVASRLQNGWLQFHKDVPRPQEAIITQSVPKVAGVAVSRLFIVPEGPSDAFDWATIPADRIVAMDILPPDGRIGPFAGMLTHREAGCHAQARAQTWEVPHALWPPGKSLQAWADEWVYFEVTAERVILRRATDREIRNARQQAALHRPSPPVQIPRADFTGDQAILLPGHADNLRVDRVGGKIAHVHQLRGAGLFTGVSEITLSLASGWTLPFALLKNTKPEVFKAWKELRWIVEFARHRGVFLRISTNAEDLDEVPGLGAGVYFTHPHIMEELTLLSALRQGIRQVDNRAATHERALFGIDRKHVGIAAWIVPTAIPVYSFLMYTADMALKRPQDVIIKLVQGFGDGLMGVPGFPDIATLDKSSGKILSTIAGDKQTQSVARRGGGLDTIPIDPQKRFFQNPQAKQLLKALRHVGSRIEELKGRAQDIEGVLCRHPLDPSAWEIVLLQTRSYSRTPLLRAS